MKKPIFNNLPKDGKWVSSNEEVITTNNSFKEAFPYGIAISSKGLQIKK